VRTKNEQFLCRFSLDAEDLVRNSASISSQRSRWKHFLRHWQESGVLTLPNLEDLKKQLVAFDPGHPLALLHDEIKNYPIEEKKESQPIRFADWEESPLGKIRDSYFLERETDQVDEFIHVIEPALHACQTVRIIDNFFLKRINVGRGIPGKILDLISRSSSIGLVEVACLVSRDDVRRSEFLKKTELTPKILGVTPHRQRFCKFVVHAEYDGDKVSFHDRFWSLMNNNMGRGLSIQIGRGISMFVDGGNYHPTLISKVSSEDFNSMWKTISEKFDPILICSGLESEQNPVLSANEGWRTPGQDQ